MFLLQIKCFKVLIVSPDLDTLGPTSKWYRVCARPAPNPAASALYKKMCVFLRIHYIKAKTRDHLKSAGYFSVNLIASCKLFTFEDLLFSVIYVIKFGAPK